MLDTINMGAPRVSKTEYRARYKALVKRLIVLQQRAKEEGIGMVVLFEGWKGAGKGSRISDLVYNLDARDTTVHVTEDLSPADTQALKNDDFHALGYYPPMSRFWEALGNRNGMTFYDRGWYSLLAQYLIDHVAEYHPEKLKKKKGCKYVSRTIERSVEAIHAWETQLAADGYLVVKFFLHIDEETQRKRLTKLHDDPATRWRVPEDPSDELALYKATYRVYDELLKRTDFAECPWILLDALDRRRVNLAVVQVLVEKLEEALEAKPDADAEAAKAAASANSASQGSEKEYRDERVRSAEENAQIKAAAEAQAAEQAAQAPKESRFYILPDHSRLRDVDHSLTLSREDYKVQLKAEQARLFRLEQEMYIKRMPLIVMYEGWDAAGKGGSIKRVAQALDARSYTIFPSPAPTKQDLAHPHLWRYWTRLPRAGHVGIYDRSWYGRVLVERIEGFASTEQWARAYDEINEFEYDLVGWGALLIKFWVDISPENQLARFIAREENPDKSWKLTSEDWRNRDKYPQYRQAVEDMFRLTSTDFAPWIILESDDKLYARIKALRIINEKLEECLHGSLSKHVVAKK
ncbi:MAG: polyphosphate--AMP phosphotransferase [Coriobacteriia bacterium]|nr:polyphosphate--AMP phosphotransferase [Coriobacteriia bacterium]